MSLRFRVFTALLIIYVAALVPLSAFTQTLEELLREAKDRERGVVPGGPGIAPTGLEREEEKPSIPTGVLMTEERTYLDRKINPEEYTVGPGDEFTIYLWGQLDAGQLLRVNPEGKLLIPYVGPVEVSGVTLVKAKDIIVRRVKERYDKVDVSVELSNLRRFRVFVTGEVEKPGTYQAWSVDRVFDLTEKAGGIKEGGSKRNIRVYNQNGDILSADQVSFLNIGDLSANPYVNTGDVIYVPPEKEVVTIFGAVSIEGIYEFREGENISDLIDLAGGLQPSAWLDEVDLVRFKEDGITKDYFILDLREVSNKGNPSSNSPDRNLLLKPDDQVFIRHMRSWHPKMVVWTRGELNHPGAYPIEEGTTTLTQLIKQAGGFTEDAFLAGAKITRWVVYQAPDPELERLKEIAKVAGGVEEMSELEYEYFKTKSREEKGSVAVNFEKLFLQGDMSQDIFLKHGDMIDIPRKQETINVSGQVRYPGLTPFELGKRVSFYIDRSGGYSWNANKDKTRVIKGKTGLWLKPDKAVQIEPGDTIFVPERRELNWWMLVRETSTVLAQAATFVMIARTVMGY